MLLGEVVLGDTTMPSDTTATLVSRPTARDDRPEPTHAWAGVVPLSLPLLVPLQFSGGFLQYAILFFVLAVVAALVGLRGVAGISMEIARILVLVFLVLAVVSLVL
jgi:uncharacterized membrane protein YtjA (UPF0391 family)